MFENQQQPTEHNNQPTDYHEVLSAHPAIQTAIDTVRTKRQINERERSVGKLHNESLDSTIDGYIGGGKEKSAFRVDDYAVKIVHNNLDYGVNNFNQQLAPLERAVGVPHLEQMVTHDKDAGVFVTELLNGRPVASISSHNLTRAIKPQHISELRETLSAMHQRGLHHDNIGNVLFDEQEGFNFVDPQFAYSDGSTPDNMSPGAFPVNDIDQLDVDAFLQQIISQKSIEKPGLIDAQGETERTFTTRSRIAQFAIQRALHRNTQD